MSRGINIARGLLSRREWVYLFGLLVPLAAYDLILKAVGILSQDETRMGFLGLMWSDLLFNLGYALVWIGLFAVARRGRLRYVVLVLFHALALIVATIATCAFEYLRSTGSTLDYGVISYYLSTLGEVRAIISSETPFYIWLILAVALFYALAGPWLITQALCGSGREEDVPVDEERASGRGLTRQQFLAAGVGAGAGALFLRQSLLPRLKSAEGSYSRAPVPNLIATKIEESRLENAWEGVDAVNTLAKVHLEKTAWTKPRHVALIHLESVRERSVTPYNRDLGTMPYLSELANRSLLVERAYTTTPHTSKAVTSINAGIYPHPTTDIIEAVPGALPVPCLPELLGEHGYRTAWFQSATKTFEERANMVENYGYRHFQAFEDMPTEGFQKSNYLGYEDDIMLGPSRGWLEEDLSRPSFVMYLGVTPHHQYLPIDRYGRRPFSDQEILDHYLNNIYYDDFWVKNIIEQYKELGIYEDTIFIIYGDHGEAFGEHGVKGHDGVPYEEGLRVPLIVHDPQRFSDGERIEGPVHLTDFTPTIVDMLGLRVVGGRYPGASLLRELPEDRVLHFSCRPDFTALATIRGYEKYIYHFGKKPEEYYDLSRDPREQNNLASRLSKKQLEELRSEALKWRSSTAAVYDEAEESKAG
jgi:lipoteichoic acid synthase